MVIDWSSPWCKVLLLSGNSNSGLEEEAVEENMGLVGGCCGVYQVQMCMSGSEAAFVWKMC